MTRRRWIADEFSSTAAILKGEHARHLTQVLRVRVGQEFDIATGTQIRRGRVIKISDDQVEFELGEEILFPQIASITLALAVFKFDRMEWAIEKCTELGAAKIIPVIARRTDVHLAAAATKRVDRWRRLALQAAEQSRRTTPPEIAAPLKFSEAINLTAAVRIVLSESEQQASLRDILESQLAANSLSKIILAVGPEGGWIEDELHQFQKSGWLSASLGPTILRAETAAIAATVIAISAQ